MAQGVEENVQMGINLSRSTVRTFEHNDMDDLERVLQVSVDRSACMMPRLQFSSSPSPPGAGGGSRCCG